MPLSSFERPNTKLARHEVEQVEHQTPGERRAANIGDDREAPAART